MTKEELKQEAEEKAGIYFDSLDYDHGNVSDTPFSSYDVYTAYEKGAMDFAEPRERRIEELEKRCANYEMNISKMEKGTCDICKETEKDKKILDLEKENAELKAQKHISDCVEYCNTFKYACMQLTKAKELLERFLGLGNLWDLDCKDYFPLRKKAEQFLSEVEK